MTSSPDPQPGEFWSTSKGRTVEILARDEVVIRDGFGYAISEADVIAYKFLGGSLVHLRDLSSLRNWTKVEFE